jgi:acyl dehydratase
MHERPSSGRSTEESAMTQPRPAATEPYVGLTPKPRAFTVTPELVEAYREGLGLPPSPRVPLMLANVADTGNFVLFSQQRGHLWLRQEWEFHAPLALGVPYSAEGRVADIYRRRDRTILLTETVLRAPGGEAVSVQRHHQSFLLDAPAEVRLRAPTEKEGARAFAPPAGREVASLERTITLAMCVRFFQGARSYHADADASRALGFSDVVVGGRMTMAYVGELLEGALGERWARSGRLLVKFTNVLAPGESIRARLLLTGPLADDRAREGVFATVERDDGTTILVAEGSVARAG